MPRSSYRFCVVVLYIRSKSEYKKIFGFVLLELFMTFAVGADDMLWFDRVAPISNDLTIRALLFKSFKNFSHIG